MGPGALEQLASTQHVVGADEIMGDRISASLLQPELLGPHWALCLSCAWCQWPLGNQQGMPMGSICRNGTSQITQWWHCHRPEKVIHAAILSPAAPRMAAVSLVSRKVLWRELLSLDQLDRVGLKHACGAS